LTVLITDGGFDHHAVDRHLRGQLTDIMITGPANEAHRRHGRGSLWGVRAEESHGRRMLYRRGPAAETRARQQSSCRQLISFRLPSTGRRGRALHRCDGWGQRHIATGPTYSYFDLKNT
jgi:3'-phosphoadenosine 5'-phosphosulfate sulfotransferase (PAPS reductase)/FAD synthetase